MHVKEIALDREHSDRLRREADRERLALSARNQTTPRRTLTRPVASWAGRKLMRAGFALLVWSKEWDYRSKTLYNEVDVAV
jgi:hypothetical protein